MAPQEAGPTRRLPGFRRREFWFRSNSVLAAFFLLAQPPRPPGRGPSSAEPARPSPSGSGYDPGPASWPRGPGLSVLVAGRRHRCSSVTAPTQPAAPRHPPFAHPGLQDIGWCTSPNQAIAVLSPLTHTDFKNAYRFCFVHFCNSRTFHSLLIPFDPYPFPSASSPRDTQTPHDPGLVQGLRAPSCSFHFTSPTILLPIFILSCVPRSPCHFLGLLLSRGQSVPLAPGCETL